MTEISPNGQLEQSLARIRSADGTVAGTAFLVGHRAVLTCAHVVERARQADDGSIAVEFPLRPGSAAVPGRVTVWVPARDDDTGDIAVLTLGSDPPPGTGPAPLTVAEDLWGHSCRIFGFPAGRHHGVWVSGVLRGRQAAGWVQLENSRFPGYFVEPGFSGAPIWDDELNAVVGMTVAAEADRNLRAAYMIPTGLLAEAWDGIGALAVPRCPYRGLSAFREQDAAVFFGREDIVEHLFRHLTRRSFVAVVGPSGTGKSSLVAAGLLPLTRRRPDWSTATMRVARASSGVAALGAALLPLLETGQTETERLTALVTLTTALKDGHLRDVVARILARTNTDRLLLIIDQFEEVFGVRREDPTELIEILLGALDQNGASGLTVLLTLRSDFLGQALQLPALAERLRGSIDAVGQMDRERLRKVIESPLPDSVTCEPGLVDRILDDVGDDACRLPLLEFTLTLLWEGQENRRLTHAEYSRLGGVKGSVAQYAEQIYSDRATPAEREQFRRLMIQLVRPTETGNPIRRVARRAELDEERWRLGQRLAETRLLVADRDALGSETLELVHEALVDEWARLRDWARRDREFRTWQEDLRAQVAKWDSTGRNPGALLRGVQLAEAVRWLGERAGDIADSEQQYIRAGSLLQGRAVRRLWTIVAALTVLTLVASGFGILAVRRGHAAEILARESQSRYLIGQAAAIGNSDFENGNDLSLLLSAAAYKFAPNDQSVANITSAANSWRYVSYLLATDGADAIAFDPAQPSVLAVADDDELALWDVVRRERIRSTTAEGDIQGSPAFSPDGKSVAFAETSRDRGYRLRVWRHATASPTTLADGSGPDDSIDGIHFSQDGKRLAACTGQGFRMWSADDPTRRTVHAPPVAGSGGSDECPFALLGSGDEILFGDGTDLVTWSVAKEREVDRISVPFPTDAEHLPVADEVQRVVSISASARTQIAIIAGPAGIVWWDIRRRRALPGYDPTAMNPSPTPSLSADGRWAYFPNGSVVAMDSRQLVKMVPGKGESLSKITHLNSDGSIAALADAGMVEVTRLADFDPPLLPNVQRFAIWPDGNHLTTVGHNGEVTAWMLHPLGRYSRTTVKAVPGSNAQAFSLSNDGGHYAAVDSGQRIHVWDVTTQRPAERILDGPWHALRAIDLDPSGAYVAAADDVRVHVVQVSDGAIVASIPLPEGYFVASDPRAGGVSIGPGGRYLAATDGDSGGSAIWAREGSHTEMISQPGSLRQPVFSPDGRWLAAKAGDSVIIWDPLRRAEIRRFAAEGIAAVDQRGTVIALVVRNGSGGSSIEVRDIGSGHVTGRIQPEGDFSTVFTPDGSRLATTNNEIVTEYPLDPAWARERVCGLAGRELTRTEWRTYAAGFPYMKVCS